MKPHRGSLILILGILSVLGLVVLGPLAWWLGTQDLRQMEEGQIDPAGKVTTNLGRFLGMISTVLTGVILLAGLVVNLVAGG